MVDQTSTQKKYRTVGILGGMGPAASVDFYHRVVAIAQTEFHAEQDTDFPPMYLYNLPLDGFDETGFVDAEKVKGQLVSAVQKLESMGSDFIVIPCNTVHTFIAAMQEAITIPIVSIIDAVVDTLLAKNIRTVGLLTSQSTRNYQLYESAFAQKNIQFISATDDEQKQINRVIHHVMAGTQGPSDIAQLTKVVDRFVQEGAEGVLLGCTELPLAITQADVGVPLFNSSEILAHRTLVEAFKD